MVKINVGDRVSGRRIVYDEYMDVTGIVTDVDGNFITVRDKNGHVNWFGLNQETKIISRAEAPKLPGWAVGWCHYCGAPARSFGFFDEPTCRECGG